MFPRNASGAKRQRHKKTGRQNRLMVQKQKLTQDKTNENAWKLATVSKKKNVEYNNNLPKETGETQVRWSQGWNSYWLLRLAGSIRSVQVQAVINLSAGNHNYTMVEPVWWLLMDRRPPGARSPATTMMTQREKDYVYQPFGGQRTLGSI